MPDSEQPNIFLKTIRKMLSPEKIPGWTGLLILALLQIASVSGAIELYMPAIRAAGGIAVALIDTITSPAIAIALAFFSGLYLWLVSAPSTPRERYISAVIFWGFLGFFSVPFCSIMLLGILMDSSRIPELVAFVDRQTVDRRIDDKEYDKVYAEFRKLQGKIIPFSVYSVRDPEAMQLANQILSLVRDSGLTTENDSLSDRGPVVVDYPSPSARGLIMFARDNHNARSSAFAIRDAFNQASIRVQIQLDNNNNNDQLLLLVGYR
jgi:hypothetical protein